MPLAIVKATSITTESCKGTDPEGTPGDGRHWRQGSVVDLCQSDYDYFLRQTFSRREDNEYTGHIVTAPCIEAVAKAAQAPVEPEATHEAPKPRGEKVKP